MAISEEPVLNLNEVEKQEIEESQPLAAGATNPYNREAYAAGLQTASAERGMGLGYGPGNDLASANPAQGSLPGGGPGAPHAGDAGLGSVGEESKAHGLQKVAEGVKEALGLK